MQILKEKIQAANKIVILSGAGLSAPSGIKTFRDNGGLWNTYQVEDVATTRAFKTNPKIAWEFYDLRRSELPTFHPNEAHIQIGLLQKSKPVTLLTQNVDDLLERAGCSNVIHLHGTLLDTKCDECDYLILNDTQSRSNDYIYPECRRGTLRPCVVLFGELLSYDEFYIADAAISALTKDNVLIVVGTSLEVHPVCNFPNKALRNGAIVIEINKKAVLFGNDVYQIEMDCAEAFRLLF
jgi:NAD-dependent deacetylase